MRISSVGVSPTSGRKYKIPQQLPTQNNDIMRHGELHLLKQFYYNTPKYNNPPCLVKCYLPVTQNPIEQRIGKTLQQLTDWLNHVSHQQKITMWIKSGPGGCMMQGTPQL